MSVLQQTASQVPTGVWTTDRLHSSFEYSIKHMAVATFRGGFDDFAVSLSADEAGDATLVGVARVASAATQDPNLDAHLQSPDFFDAERHPEVTYRSTRIVLEGPEDIVVDGELTLKGITRPVQLRGTIA